jgi:glycosyltransferase involved in cell wall biosynthesis
VDPLDTAAITGGIDRALAEHERLRAAGPAQARRFSWDAAADGLIDTYRALAGPRQ